MEPVGIKPATSCMANLPTSLSGCPLNEAFGRGGGAYASRPAAPRSGRPELIRLSLRAPW